MSVKRFDTRHAALHTGTDTYLDHLGVFAALLDIPLLVTEESTFRLAKKFYPSLEVYLCSHLQLSLPFLAENFDVIYVSSHLFASEMIPLLRLFCQKKMRMIYVPHGNSDKGHSGKLSFLKDIHLYYGKQMFEQLHQTDLCSALVPTGNFRRLYYERHKPFYDLQIQTELAPKLSPSKKTLLYAPTWNDGENETSFFAQIDRFINDLLGSCNLMVKLHPFLIEQSLGFTEQILSRYREKPDLIFLIEYPPIYPLLNLVDGYVGDHSSVGYDFLSFDKPLFFFATSPGPLRECGLLLDNQKNLLEQIHGQWDYTKDHFRARRKELYTYAFGLEKSEKEIEAGIEEALSSEQASWIRS